MKKRLSLIITLALSASLLLAGCAKKDDGVFKVGMECGYAPFNWTQTDDSNGAVPIEGTKEYAGGYDIEIAKKIAEGLGQKLVIVKTKWDGLVPAVQSGKIDAIIAGMSPTADRKKQVDFSDKYYNSNLVMVVKKGGAYEKATSIQDFSGAKITAQLNTFHYTVVSQINGVKKQPAMSDFPAMRVALEAGAIDGYVSERPEGLSAAAANSKLTMVEFADGNGFKFTDDDVSIAVGLKKDSKIKDKINKVLAGLSSIYQHFVLIITILSTGKETAPKMKLIWNSL